MKLLAKTWNGRNIRAESLIKAKGTVATCQYGKRHCAMYGAVIIGNIDQDYTKELIKVKWDEMTWKDREEETVSWSKVCLTTDRKNRACTKPKKIQLAYMNA